jgi:hypothetical protein
LDRLRQIQPETSAPREHGVNASPPEDQYFKGALFLNTIRTLADDDAKWFAFLHDFFQHFKYQNITTEDVVRAPWPIAGRRTRPLSPGPSGWELLITGRSSNRPLPGRWTPIKKEEFQIPTDLYYVLVAG